MVKVTEVDVFGRIVTIYKHKHLKELASEYGHYEYDKSKILVDSDLKGDIKMITYMHEMIHALIDRLHIQMPSGLEEQLCDVIPIMLVKNMNITMKSNPKT